MHKNIWPKGAKAEVAERVGISQQSLSNILSGRTGCPRPHMLPLQSAVKDIMGVDIPLADWVTNTTTTNPYFHNGKKARKT